MDDRRLVWNQVEAPDLSAASAALARANQSFTSGLGSAQDILAQYGKGVVEKNDNALLSELAGIGSEAEFDAFVDGGGLEGRNISEGLRTLILDTRSGLVDQAGVRARTGLTGAQTEGTRARTGIALAQEGRVASDYAYGVRQRDELAELSSALVSARTEGRQYGNATVGPQGDALENYLASTIQSESGGDPNARNPNSSATGLGQFTTGTWNQLMAKYPELGLTADGRTDPAQSERALRQFTADNAAFLKSNGFQVTEGNLYASHFLGNGGARAVLSSGDNEQLTDILPANVIEANPFLRGMSVARFRQWSAEKGGGNAPAPSVTTQRDAFRDALANSQTLTPSQIASLLEQANGAQAIGQTLLDDADSRATAQGKQLVDEIGASIINDVLGNAEITTSGEFDAAVRDHSLTSQLTESEVLDLIQRGAGVRSTEAGGNILAPDVAGIPDLDANVASTVAAAEASLRSTDQNRALGDIEAFTEDPAGALTKALDLGSDDENPGGLGGLLGAESGFDQNQLRNLINDYAREFNVEPAVVAVAMRDAFERDPIGRNTLSNRFDRDRVEAAVQQLDQDAIRNYRERRSNNQLMEIELSSLQAQAVNLQRQIAKTSNPSQRQALQAQLDALNGQVAVIEDRRQGN